VNLLALDTSTRWAGVAVLKGEDAPVERVWRSEQNHGVELMPAVSDALGAAGITAQEVTHLAVAIGPGGFSALRVGISAAIGIAVPRALPVAGISTFDLEATPYLHLATSDAPVIAVIPAGRGELAWARYEGPDGPAETGLSTAAALAARSLARARFCGEGVADLFPVVDGIRLLGGPPPTRSPGVLARLAMKRFEAGLSGDLDSLRPVYFRQPSITRPGPAA
jgi:tRNA threonylcarbamoyladenosine biosynthesis protein TsaB